MRSIVIAALVVIAGCERGVPRGETRSSTDLPSEPTTALAGVPTVAETKPAGSCGGSCGAACGQGGSCCGGAMAAPSGEAAPVPADAVWTSFQVTGMKCGGCARKIERALAGVDGVLGVEVDHVAAQVRVATVKGVDARRVAAPAIDALGYRVQ
jgi:copper chaperone CopZ